MNFLMAFLIGGIICAIGQILIEVFKLTPGFLTCLFVIIGAFLEFGDIYDKIISIGYSGATLPITSFGHSLAHAAYEGGFEGGFLGILSNILKTTSPGIVMVIILSVLIGLIFRPKG